jgi:glycosyltransferase involved in cell wall biosynthesis
VATLPVLLPFFQMSQTINSANHLVIRRMLRRWARSLGFRTPILWFYTPFSEPLIDRIEHTGTVYECVDEFRAARGFVRASTVGAMEDALLRKIDVAIVTQENLYPRRAALCRNTYCVPNGADTDAFRAAAMDNLPPAPLMERFPKPRLVFVGHIQYWIDLGLIAHLASRRPGWSFILIGPIGPLADKSPVKGLPNVHFVGRQPQSEIPRLLKSADVCLNPYITGELADNCSPLKLYEYLAAGKPIVSTEMPEAHKFSDDVRIAGSYDDFLNCCEAVIRSLPESEKRIAARMAGAEQHSWQNRFIEVNRILERTVISK